MKKFLKRVIIIITYVIILLVTKCFGYTIETDNIYEENQQKYNVKTYNVTADEEKEFLENLKELYTADGVIYTLKNMEKEDKTETLTRNITTTKTITTNTNDKAKIIEKLPQTIDYNQDGYTGMYELNTNNLDIKSHYNGYSEYLVEENKQYKDLQRNDLDFIPKQITKNGITLDLLNTDWEIQETKQLGETEVADKYIANCYYAGKIKKDNPYTYTITATYTGVAEKTEEIPFIYTVYYEMQEIQEPLQEDSKINIMPILGGSGAGLILAVFFFIRKNAKVYNLQYGHWKLVGKAYIRKPEINITRFSSTEVTNRYKIELSKNAMSKLKLSKIQVIKGSKRMEHKIKSKVESYTFEITI